MLNIHELATEQMNLADIDHHDSDLYLKVTPVSRELVQQYDYKNLVTTFIDNIDHVLWYEIPFAWTGERYK